MSTTLLSRNPFTCCVCFCRIHSHDFKLECTLCHSLTHLSCLPHVNKNDSLYINRNSENWYCSVCTQSIFPFNHYDDDDDFIEALKGECNCVNLNSFACDKFLDVHEIDDVDMDNPLASIDSDIHYFQDNYTAKCKYFDEGSFTKMVEQSNVQPNSLSLMHVNVRSVQRNYDNFESYMHSLKHSFDVVALSETWLNDVTADNFNPIGYTAENAVRQNRQGGGVSILINESLTFKRRSDLSITKDSMECLFIEMPKPEKINNVKSESVIVGVVYRPPNTCIKNFIGDFTQI